MKELTKRQQEVLSFLTRFIDKHAYPPTIRETAAYFNISVKGAHDHIKALAKKGKIRWDVNRSRAIEILSKSEDREAFLKIPVLGNVAAGQPLFAEENLEGYMTVPSNLLGKGTYFALNVHGDSMQDAGILDKDRAIISRQDVADNGDIVVAMINDEAVTLKRFFREKNRIKLKAENPVYPPIYTQNLRILGKLSCIIRNYE